MFLGCRLLVCGTALAGLGGALCGCGLVIGADDYEAREIEGGEGEDDPVLPMQPDVEVQAQCKECALEHCDELRHTCLDDPGCRQMLECKNACDDPDCLMWCDWQYPDSLDYDDYRTCVFGPAVEKVKSAPVPTECEQACRGGENWGCVDYDWRLRGATRVPVRLRLLRLSHTSLTDTNAGFPGLDVRVCDGDRVSECSHDWSGTTDERGLVEFSLLVPGGARLFPAYLELRHETQMPMLLHLPPFRSASRLTVPIYESSTFGVPPARSPRAGAVVLSGLDCTLRPSWANVSFHLEPQDEARRAAWTAEGWDFEETPSGWALFTDVPPSTDATELEAVVRSAAGDVVARQRIWVRADWITSAWLVPRSSG